MAKQNYYFKLDSSVSRMRKDGSYPVVLLIRKDGKTKKLALPFTAIPEQWSDDFQLFEVDKWIILPDGTKKKRSLHPDRENNNKSLKIYDKRCEDVLKEFYERRLDWTLDQFEKAVLNKTDRKGIEQYFLHHIEKLDKSGKTGNKFCYQNTLNILRLFEKEVNHSEEKFAKRVFSEIDLKYVNSFHDYLYSNRGCSKNTIKYYMRALRALLNKAISDKEASGQTYPFGKNGYSVAELTEETEKRYLPSVYLDKIKVEPLKTFPLNWCRNLFLFSYYCQGISFVDMASLTKDSIKFDSGHKCIVYKRQKTEAKARFIYIQISEPIQNLLDWFKGNCVLTDNHLVPIVSVEGYEGEKLYNHIRNRNKKFNIHLKNLVKELKLDGVKLTSYVSRHSYAMRLKEANISEDVISEALGHKDLATTKIYLSSFGSKVIAEANKKL